MGTEKTNAVSGARTTVRLPEELHHRAKLASAWSGTKLQDFVSAAVEQYLVAAEEAMPMDLSQGKRPQR